MTHAITRVVRSAPFAGLHALALLALVSCQDAPATTDPCEGVSCSGHGTCTAVGTTASCTCEPGFEADGLQCLSSEACDDADRDGHGVGCAAGSDCDDTDASRHDDCPGCTDGDGDGHGDGCPTGADCNDGDGNNWESCASCVDADGDGSFVGCDAYATIDGPDCDDGDATASVDCADPCAGVACGHGACVDGTCDCELGWAGAACDACDAGYELRGDLCLPADACVDPARCYYVAPDGAADWTACRDITTPCAWQTAMAEAVAGDVVYFRGGDYYPGPGTGCGAPVMSPSNSGAPGTPITFRGHPNEVATIHDGLDPAGNNCGVDPSGTQPAIGAYAQNHIVWSDFTLIRDLETGRGASTIVSFDLCEGCAIINSELIGVTRHVDHTNGVLIMVVNSVDVTIANNKMHDMEGLHEGDPGWIESEDTVNTGALWIFGDSDTYIYNNDIYNVVNGLQWKDNPNNIHAYNNHISSCSRSAINAGNGVPGPTTDYFIHNNVIRDCAVAVHSFDPPVELRNLRFYNNTIYNSGVGGVAILGKPTAQPHRNTEIFNNIFYNAGAGDPLLVAYYNDPEPAQLPTYADYNLFFGPGHWDLNDTSYSSLSAWQTASGLDAHSLTVDPQFVAAGGPRPEDYQLAPGSPARAVAPDHRDVDGDGDTAELIDMGAFVTGDEIIGAP